MTILHALDCSIMGRLSPEDLSPWVLEGRDSAVATIPPGEGCGPDNIERIYLN
jgi:hypothetical protein